MRQMLQNTGVNNGWKPDLSSWDVSAVVGTADGFTDFVDASTGWYVAPNADPDYSDAAQG